MSFQIVITGRTNVGKSTLFNKLTGGKNAITYDAPHITRDKLCAYSELLGCDVTDTAGIENNDDDPFATQSLEAVTKASLILFITDGKKGLLNEDRICLKKIHKANKKKSEILLLINKADCKITHDNDFSALGLGAGIRISAEHNIGLEQLRQLIINNPLYKKQNTTTSAGPRLNITLIGQPNVGKSSLTNTLLGYKRTEVSDIAGTTREAVMTTFQFREHNINLIDNAGIRRRYLRDKHSPENMSVQSSTNAVDHADVVILLTDASLEAIRSQDLRLADSALSKNKPLIIAANKSDITQNRALILSKLSDVSRQVFLNSPVIDISAKTGWNCDKLLHTALAIHKQNQIQIPTDVLNNWLQEITTAHSPQLTSLGKETKLKHITQCGTAPPHFKIYINTVEDNIGTNYKRYLMNKLRDKFNLSGIPLVIRFVTSKNPYRQRQ